MPYKVEEYDNDEIGMNLQEIETKRIAEIRLKRQMVEKSVQANLVDGVQLTIERQLEEAFGG